MKCPKCGYNSFEYHDSCIKCSNDLTGFKSTYGLVSMVLPLEVRIAMAESMAPDTADQVAAAEAPNDMFSFDLPDEESTSGGSPTLNNDDPFNFDDEPLTAPGADADFSFDDDLHGDKDKAETDAFADLLESTSQKEADPVFSPSAPAPAPASAPAAASQGEFDMNNFSWDEPETAAGGSAAKPAEDDFNSLFGDKDSTEK